MNAMPSVLIETGFINHPEESHYIASEKGQTEIAESIYNAIIDYKKAIDRKAGGSFTTKNRNLKNQQKLR